MSGRMTIYKSKLFVLAILTALLVPWIVQAHEIRPAIADLTFEAQGGYQISISLNLEALIAEIGPQHKDTSDAPNAKRYDQLRALAPVLLRSAFEGFSSKFLEGIPLKVDGKPITPQVTGLKIPEVGDKALARISTVVLGGPLPAEAKTLTWAYDKAFGASVIRVRGPKAAGENQGPVTYSAYLQNGAPSAAIPVVGVLAQSFGQVFANYITIGFTHIVPKGLDHILFVVGLFLLSSRLRSLLWQVTSFTLAHSVTLALGIYGVVQISPAIVEPLIAASIVYVCIENVLTDRLQRWRPMVVFGFGLLHGLGFASVLTEIGLAKAHFITGLVAFNLGVEFGQLAVIALCFLLVGLWFRHKPWYRKVITIPASLVIAAIGAWWFVERVFFA